MRFSLSFFAAVALALVSGRPGVAAVIFSTFGPDDSYDLSGGQALYQLSLLGETLNVGVAVSFVPAEDVRLGEIRVAIEAPPKPFTVTVTGNNDYSGFGSGFTDGPGGLVEVFDATGTSSPEILRLTSKTNPLLTAGTKYWIEINPGPTWTFSFEKCSWIKALGSTTIRASWGKYLFLPGSASFLAHH